MQGSRLKASREIRIANVFRDALADFIRMIVVYELAHLKEREQNKAFYRLHAHLGGQPPDGVRPGALPQAVLAVRRS